jgi:hypothetical protein
MPDIEQSNPQHHERASHDAFNVRDTAPSVVIYRADDPLVRPFPNSDRTLADLAQEEEGADGEAVATEG